MTLNWVLCFAGFMLAACSDRGAVDGGVVNGDVVKVNVAKSGVVEGDAAKGVTISDKGVAGVSSDVEAGTLDSVPNGQIGSDEFDPNFHIYLAFGQSNMEGVADFTVDDALHNPRVQLLRNANCPNLQQQYGSWYEAAQPYSGCWGKLGVADGFMARLAEQAPPKVTLGLVIAAVGGSDIALFEKGAPIGKGQYGEGKVPERFAGGYAWLLDLAQKAQKRGVIKGIIFHQGETNTGQPEWKHQVAAIVADLKRDLKVGDVPFIAGEVLAESEESCCWQHNIEVNQLPQHIPNAHVISSADLAGADYAHFTHQAYMRFGHDYANKMVELVYAAPLPWEGGRCGSADSQAPAFADAFSLEGRFSFAVDRLCFSWPGSSVAFHFHGTRAALPLANKHVLERDQRIRFHVIVDEGLPSETAHDVWLSSTGQASALVNASGQRRSEEKAGKTPAANHVVLVSGLKDGEHSVRLTRATEAFTAVSEILAAPIVDGKLLPPPEAKARKLLFIGDSITAGYGVEGESKACGYSHETSSVQRSFAGLAAHRLRAQAHFIAWSGIGVWRSYGEAQAATPTMLTRYGRTLANDGSGRWPPSFFQPDAVVVGLGTNDYWDGVVGEYGTAMGELIGIIRADYPTAPIYLMASPMLGPPKRTEQLSILRSLAIQNSGVELLDLGAIEQEEGFGCDYHPSLATQQRLAGNLVAQLKSDLNWTLSSP